ncbi:MAG TPA: hypothetical protein VFR80_06880, partial [Pyrinomonadaceae bacterium]|nr:hypothetical protein [Pyrinomonadaceae bacterium]
SLISLLLPFITIPLPTDSRQQATARLGRIETNYDSNTDKTTVRLLPVQISGDRNQYHSVHIAPSFSYAGREFKRPDAIEFEVQTVVKTKLKIDLYVVFVVDGETIFLSSNRSAVKRPVPGKRWVGERLIFRMPYETLMKIKMARTVEIKMDSVRFPLSQAALEQIHEFARLTHPQ